MRRALLALVALVGLLVTHPAHAWWNGDWPYRMKVNADAGPKGANITQPIGRTQILLRLHSGNFNFATVKEDGSDLRFVAVDDKTPLKFHIARFDALVDQVALVWVDIPDLAPGTTTPFYMYWGNKNATAGGDPRSTYDPDQLLVYHFGEENGLPKDSTANGINALTTGKRDDAGITGFALRLDGTAPIQMPQVPALAVAAGGAATFSTWFRVEDAVNTAGIWSQRDANGGLLIGLDKGVVYLELDQGGQVQRTSPGQPIKGGAWHRLDVVADGSKIAVYVDAQPAGELAIALPAIGGQALLAGAIPPAVAATAPAAPAAPTPTPPAATNGKAATPAAPPPPVAPVAVTPPPTPVPAFTGLLSEFQISKVARPLGAIQLANNVQGPQASLLSFEQPEESSVFGTGYIGIILKSVTIDAWVVIGILGIMLVVSWVVMVGKALYTSSLGRANRAFLAAFETEAEDTSGRLVELSELKRPILKKSSLWRLYRVGLGELRSRVSRGRLSADEPVPPRSLTAIRSAMDAMYVVEVRRLNNLMVLLTIAIAGGPFIGLLGTVIGVMITFAAIAQAGDVNVNAIAPGISAALLATVAGLTVAIPALFGYNYFTIKIRDATNEMQVFMEELIARMGEGPAPRGEPVRRIGGDVEAVAGE